ncbi:MAG TPA: hypothetical protein VGH59_16755 [Casimicrobiaceae bacterium]
MKPNNWIRTAAAALASISMLIASPGASAQSMDLGDKWEFGITPYGWFPSVHGTLNFDIPPGSSAGPEVKINPSGYLSDLQFAAMVAGTARKGAWGVFYDLVYADLSGLKSEVRDVRGPNGKVSLPVTTDVNTGLRSGIVSVTGTYTILRNPSAQLDVIGGLRYAGLKTSVDWNFEGPIGLLGRSGSASKTINLTDGIIGVLGKVRLGDDGKWYVPFELDVGGGNKSNVTSNGIIGIGYQYSWGDLVLAYRYLYYDMGNDGAIHNMSLAGPALGASFRW